jgi:hypothetical protein
MSGEAPLSQRPSESHVLPSIQSHILILLLLWLCLCNSLQAAQPETPSPPPPPSLQRPSDGSRPTTLSSLIEIKIETSRPQMTAGTGLGIIAGIKNVSDTRVYIHERSIVLKVPPEMVKRGSPDIARYAYFPTSNIHPRHYHRFENSIVLQPGDSYEAFWTSKFWRDEPQAILRRGGDTGDRKRPNPRLRDILMQTAAAAEKIPNPVSKSQSLMDAAKQVASIGYSAEAADLLEKAAQAAQQIDVSSPERGDVFQSLLKTSGILAYHFPQSSPVPAWYDWVVDIWYDWVVASIPPFISTVVGTIYNELEFAFFSPGEYKIAVIAQYWTKPMSAGPTIKEDRSFFEQSGFLPHAPDGRPLPDLSPLRGLPYHDSERHDPGDGSPIGHPRGRRHSEG